MGCNRRVCNLKVKKWSNIVRLNPEYGGLLRLMEMVVGGPTMLGRRSMALERRLLWFTIGSLRASVAWSDMWQLRRVLASSNNPLSSLERTRVALRVLIRV